MTQVLIITKSKQLVAVLRGKLSKKYEAEIVVQLSSNDAISLLEILPDIGIILCDEFINKDPVANNICKYISNNKNQNLQKINVIVFAKDLPNCKEAICIGTNPNLQKLSDLIGFFLGKEEKMVSFEEEIQQAELPKEQPKELPKELSEEKTTVFQLPAQEKPLPPICLREEKIVAPEYIPMNTIYFMNLPEVVIDFSIYTRTKKSESFEYHQKFSSGAKINHAEMQRALLRSGKHLYINKTESKQANAFLNEVFLERFKKVDLTLSDRMKLNSESFEILLELFKSSLFDKYNVEIIKELIKSISILEKTPNALDIFFTGIKANKLTYGYMHTFLTYYFLMQSVDHFSWGKDQSKNKLLYLSLFHDLNLNTERLIKLHHHYFTEVSNLTDEEKHIMFIHAEACANVLEKIIKAPKELTDLIKEHHGIKSGKGFLETLSISITPTSMAFIVIEDFVTRYLSALKKVERDKPMGPTKPQLEIIFNELKVKYDRLTYLEVLVHLQKLFS